MDASALVEQANERSDLASYVFCQFQKFDADHSGYLGFRELGQALRALFKEAGLKRTPDFGALEESFDTADTDGDNKVSLDEFVAWYNHTVEWTRRLHDEAVTEVRSRKHTVYAPHSSALPSTSSPPAPPVCPLPQVTEAKKRPPLLGQSSLSSKSTKVLFDLKMQRIGGTRRTRRTRLFLSSPQLAAAHRPYLPGASAVGSGWRSALWGSGRAAQSPIERPRHGHQPRPGVAGHCGLSTPGMGIASSWAWVSVQHARGAVLAVPQLTTLASWGWPSRLLAALQAREEPSGRVGRHGRLRCNHEARPTFADSAADTRRRRRKRKRRRRRGRGPRRTSTCSAYWRWTVYRNSARVRAAGCAIYVCVCVCACA